MFPRFIYDQRDLFPTDFGGSASFLKVTSTIYAVTVVQMTPARVSNPSPPPPPPPQACSVCNHPNDPFPSPPIFLSSGVALAWPLDKYDCVTVDTTRVSETRAWGAEPRQDTEEREAKRAAVGAAAAPEAAATWGGPLGILMKLTGRGAKRPREASSSNSGGGGGGGGAVARAPRAPENPWQAGSFRSQGLHVGEYYDVVPSRYHPLLCVWTSFAALLAAHIHH